MVLFTTLALMAIICAVFAVCVLAVGGAAFVAVFADVIVCVGFIVLIMKALNKRKKK